MQPPPRPAGLEALVQRTSKAASLLGGVATVAITGLVTFDVLMRYFLNRPQLIVDEVAPFLLLLVIFGAAAQTFRVGGHVRVDLVTAHLRPAARAWLRAVNLGIGIAFLAVVIWVTTQSALTAFRYGRVSAVMLYPLWAPMLLIPAGLLLMALCMAGTLRRQSTACRGVAWR